LITLFLFLFFFASPLLFRHSTRNTGTHGAEASVCYSLGMSKARVTPDGLPLFAYRPAWLNVVFSVMES
jgi:hypothetical protein